MVTVASLAIANFEKQAEIYLYPNPQQNYFTLNTATSKVQVFLSQTTDKSFNTSQNAYQYTVGDLNNGMYVVKAYNVNEELQVMKFIKSSFCVCFC
jgi:hypothetical protein